MKKVLLVLSFLFATILVSAQCNFTLLGNSTTVVSSNTLADSAFAQSSFDSILVCAGSTLTYDYVYEYKRFFVRDGASLHIKKIQQCEVFLESGATLQIDTVGNNFLPPMITTIHFDSTNVNLIDTNQFYGANSTWVHCLGNTFNYTLFNIAPCVPLSVFNKSLDRLAVVFPNPVSDQIVIADKILEKVASAQVLNLTGQVIKSINDPKAGLSVSDLNEGVYILKLKSKNGVFVTKKFIKE